MTVHDIPQKVISTRENIRDLPIKGSSQSFPVNMNTIPHSNLHPYAPRYGYDMFNPVENALNIAWQFIPQYYSFRQSDPASIIGFYSDTSVVTVDTQTVSGLQDIRHLINSQSLELQETMLTNVQAQMMMDSGVFLVCQGAIMSAPNSQAEPRPFTQSFLLAPQITGYFVANDILLFTKQSPRAQSSNNEAYPTAKTTKASTEGNLSIHSALPVDLQNSENEKPATPAATNSSPVLSVSNVSNKSQVGSPAPQSVTTETKVSDQAIEASLPLTPGSSTSAIDGSQLSVQALDGSQISSSIQQQADEQKSEETQVNGVSADIEALSLGKSKLEEKRQDPISEKPKSWASLASKHVDKWQAGTLNTKTQGMVEQPTNGSKPHFKRKLSGNGNNAIFSYDIMIKSVPPQLDPRSLAKIFTVEGEVPELDIIKGRGMIFLKYKSNSNAAAAILLQYKQNGITLVPEQRVKKNNIGQRPVIPVGMTKVTK